MEVASFPQTMISQKNGIFSPFDSLEQWRTQEFFSGGGGSTNSVEDRKNGDLWVVAP